MKKIGRDAATARDASGARLLRCRTRRSCDRRRIGLLLPQSLPRNGCGIIARVEHPTANPLSSETGRVKIATGRYVIVDDDYGFDIAP